MSDRIVRAPWTTDQVASLEAFQESEHLTPYICRSPDCPSRGYVRCPDDALPLAADRDGLHCIEAGSCGYAQDWAHASALDWSWQQQEDRAKAATARAARRSYRRVRRDMAVLSGGFTRRDWIRLGVSLLIIAAVFALAYSPAGNWRLP